MSWRTYQAFLIVAALMAGCLMALPIWDWWIYRQAGSEPQSMGYLVPAAQAAPRASAASITPSAGRVTLAAAMGAPPAQASTPSTSPEPAASPVPSRAVSVAVPPSPAPAAAAAAATVPSARPAAWRPPTSEGRPSSIVKGGAAGAVQPPSITGPLVWVRSQPVQVPLIAPPADRQPSVTDTPDPGTGQESPDPATEPDPSPEKGPPRLSLLPGQPTVANGKVVSVRVVLAGAEGVTSVPFHLKFDPALLEYVGARTGSAFVSSSLEPLLLASVNPERPGDLAVGLALVGDSRSFSGSGSLVVIEFRAIGHGRADLTFENSSVRGVTSEPLPAEFSNTSIQVD